MTFTSLDVEKLNDLIPQSYKDDGWFVAGAMAPDRSKHLWTCVVSLGQYGKPITDGVRSGAETWELAIQSALALIDSGELERLRSTE